MMHRVCLTSVLSLVAAMFLGCGKQTPPSELTKPHPSPAATPAGTPDHEHGTGPHGGIVVDWGGGAYHVELVVDHEQKEAVVYILGDDARSPAPVPAENVRLNLDTPPVQIELLPQPLEGEVEGKSSRFVGKHETLDTVRELQGSISGEVGGTPYVGEFKESHADHEH